MVSGVVLERKSHNEIDVYCRCGRYVVLDSDDLPDLNGPQLIERLVCSECGARRPQIRLRAKSAPGGGYHGS